MSAPNAVGQGAAGSVDAWRVAACIVAALALASQAPPAVQAQHGPGEEVFEASCAVCHSIGGGRIVGPDLQGVVERRPEAWLVQIIKRAQTLVDAGDADAVALVEEYGGMVMPDQPLSDRQIRQVLDYLREASVARGAPAPLEPATEEQVLLGQALFQGTVRFANGGPTCGACHEVTHDAVIGGGVLARELTTVFSRLGGPGVRAILGSPPFPVMERAYRDKPLTEDEVVALVGFLQRADEEQAFHQPRDYGVQLASAGLAGSALLFGLYSILWRRRLRGSVNQSIFDRQVRSS